jgi:hypothetical protein
MCTDHQQIGLHAGRVFQDFAGHVAFAHDSINRDTGRALGLSKGPYVGEELVAINRS